MLDTINEYRMIDVKREQIQYIYEQNKAQAIKNSIPDPVGLLAGTSSDNWASLVMSIVYMGIDSKANYDSFVERADMEYLKEGWKLDGNETRVLNQSQSQLYDYMIDMVDKQNIPDEYALSNDAMKEFVKYKNNTNLTRRLQYLESNKNKYEKFGEYWLVLAETYYEKGDYTNCIRSISEYEKLDVNIFREDYRLARVLPLAIVSVDKTFKNTDTKISRIEYYLKQMTDALETEDWDLRYFAAQTNLKLYSESSDEKYIREAYRLIRDNINYLIDNQEDKNAEYLAEIQLEEITSELSKSKKDELKKYNKKLEERRKRELPPIYEPLYLNCELLFLLAENTNISKVEKEKIESMLYGENGVFLTEPLIYTYCFQNIDKLNDYSIEYEKGKLEIPVILLSEKSKVKLTVSRGKEKMEFDKWEIEEVLRDKKGNIKSSVAEYVNKDNKKFEYKDGDRIEVIITPVEGGRCEDIVIRYQVNAVKKMKFFESITFERVN